MAIRNSWGHSEQDLLKSRVKIVFLVGQDRQNEHEQDLMDEALMYGDILQEAFVDTYANLTIKSTLLLQWFSQNCNNSALNVQTQYVMKTDDDVYVNIPKLYSFVHSNEEPDLLMGKLWPNSVPIRDPQNKWFAPRYMFAGEKYPDFVSGTGYLMQHSVAQRLYRAALDTLFFNMEDVFVTGILSSKIGVRPKDASGFVTFKRQLNPDILKSTYLQHLVSHEEMINLYRLTKQSNMSEYW